LKITIIVFSPTGNTFKLAKMLSGCLTQKGAKVQLVDFTRNATIFRQNNRSEYLDTNIEEHEVLMIGGPVYSHHMQYQVLELIKALPQPGGKWGNLVIPFITYGKISSGEALYEAARLIRKTGRKNILGMKVEAFHCYTKKWDKKINDGMPGPETLPYVEKLVTEIMKLSGRNQCIEMKNEFPVQMDSQACIHCAECFHSCTSNAINLNIRRFKPMIIKGAQGKGFLASNELAKTELFLNESI